MDEKLIQQAAHAHQQAEQIEQQVNFVDSQISELGAFQKNLLSLESSNEEDILASMGRGVFAKAKLSSRELLVEVGAGIIVKKMPSEISSLIESQIKSLQESRIFLLQQLNEQTRKLQQFMHQLEMQEQAR